MSSIAFPAGGGLNSDCDVDAPCNACPAGAYCFREAGPWFWQVHHEHALHALSSPCLQLAQLCGERLPSPAVPCRCTGTMAAGLDGAVSLALLFDHHGICMGHSSVSRLCLSLEA